jgi:hypothetical protein
MNDRFYVALSAMQLLCLLAGLAIARAKGRGALEAVALTVLLGPLGFLVMAIERSRPVRVQLAEESWRRRGRLDWLLGGGDGSPASTPAIILSCAAVAASAFFAWQYAAGNFNLLDPATVENAIVDDLSQKGESGARVRCPARMDGSPGSVSLCDVTTSNGEAHARVTVENAGGDITWVFTG